VSIVGDPLPWVKTHDKFRFREGELTIWAGVNGNGKSLVMGQAAIWFGSPVMIASMEMQPKSTVKRNLRQPTGVEKPSRQYAEAVMDQLKGQLFIYNHVGTVRHDSILGACHYAAQEKGCKHLMIDSLVKCGFKTDDYNGQKNFVDKLTELAKEHNVHVHLVVHMRKGHNETDQPDKFDIKGAGEITDLADNVLILNRNLIKEKQFREQSRSYDELAPDVFIRVAKHRHGEWDGQWGLWWHEASQQWTARQGQAMPWPSPEGQWRH